MGRLHCELAEGMDAVGVDLISIPGASGGLKDHFLPLCVFFFPDFVYKTLSNVKRNLQWFSSVIQLFYSIMHA